MGELNTKSCEKIEVQKLISTYTRSYWLNTCIYFTRFF